MVKIRLRRMGRKHLPVYSIVAADSRAPRDGKFNEKLGFYHPFKEEFKINESQMNQWIGNGAVITDSVKKLLHRYKVLNDSTVNIKSPIKPSKSLLKPLVSLIQKAIPSRLENSDEVIINVSELYSSNSQFKRFIDLIQSSPSEPSINLRKLAKRLNKTIESSMDLGKLYNFEELKALNLFSEEEITAIKDILFKDAIDVTGILKHLKFELNDAKYREYMDKNRYLKRAKLPEKRQINLGQFLYNNNVERLLFQIES